MDYLYEKLGAEPMSTTTSPVLSKQVTLKMLLNGLPKSNPFYGRRLRDAGFTGTRLLNSLVEKGMSFHLGDDEQGD